MIGDASRHCWCLAVGGVNPAEIEEANQQRGE